jgi:hypothetical protein
MRLQKDLNTYQQTQKDKQSECAKVTKYVN